VLVEFEHLLHKAIICLEPTWAPSLLCGDLDTLIDELRTVSSDRGVSKSAQQLRKMNF
jgi:hypothetical protein